MENKLKNIFPVFDYVMENELKNNLLIFVFKFIKIMRNKSYKLKVE
jgi:hypothetical protein